MEKLIVGSDVHFVALGAARRDVCRAAKVTAIKGDDQVGLCVFNPQTLLFKHGVKLDAETKLPGTWHWPERVETPSPADQAEGGA